MPEKIKKSFSGLKAQNFNAVIMILGCLLTLFIFYTSLTIKSKYENIIFSMNDYSDCNKAISEFREASDYLTNQVRLFSFHQDTVYMKNYFTEKNEVQRREMAVDIVELSHSGDTPDDNVKMALLESEVLANTEIYAMKLICEGLHIPDEDIPDEIREKSLLDSDKLLVEEAMLQKANDLIFGRNYYIAKDKIAYYTNCAITSLIHSYVSQQNEDDKLIKNVFLQQAVFIGMLFVTCILLYIFLLNQILIPLSNNLACIQKGSKMKLKGSYEVKYIASAYNVLCEKNAVTASALKHKAEHDPLTGLINRNAFDQIKEALVASGEPLAYLIIDIDLFKQINDKYGHLTGDEVLKKIASLLMEQFRATDYVARIGGDEFAVIMTKFGITPVDIIQRKITELNTKLQNVSDDIPSVSLSVGVAFSENGYIPEVEKKADEALYNVKRGGRCNCSFYEL